MTVINTNLSVQVKGGPPISVPPVIIDAQAYDKIGISIEPATEVTVNVQPGDSGVNFLLIKSTTYTSSGDSDAKLTYTPNDKSAIDLETPQIYLGKEAIKTLLGSVKTIAFSNKLDKKVEIEILVGRDPVASS